jgi:3'(2'), 5'-bisphosphate nucleotidase
MYIDIEYLLNLARQAGSGIMEIYNSDDFGVEIKKDRSPLTTADIISHEIIVTGLEEEYPDIPIISEEDKKMPSDERKDWEYFWLVDPLDGTKEFIKQNGEFTVNIALIHENYPIMGIIYAPVSDEFYFSDGEQAYKMKGENPEEEIKVHTRPDDKLISLQSRSHSTEEEENFYKKYNIKRKKSKGSSLKFCLMAEGGADLYFRGGPTWEWDTAAGQAILEAAGGLVMTHNFQRFSYNKDSLLNPGFVCLSNESLIK